MHHLSRKFMALSPVVLLIALCLMLSGCITLPEVYRPNELETPAKVSCIQLPTVVGYTGLSGGFIKSVREHRLEPGPYFSEKVDEEGTYYRGLAGSLLIDQSATAAQAIGTNSNTVRHDGGFWIPRDPKAWPRLYRYISGGKSVEHDTRNVDCSTLNYARDPATNRLNYFWFATGGIAAGTTVRTLGMTSASYGQAALRGAVAGLVLAGLIDLDVGRIELSLPVEDQTFADQLRGLASKAVPMKEMPWPQADEPVRPAP